MISLRTRLFIIISLVVLFLLAISIFLVMRGKNKTSVEGENLPTTVDSTNFVAPIAAPDVINPESVAPGVTVKKATTLEAEQNGVIQLARIFTERFNTYSSDNGYNNIRDVEALVSTDLWKTISAPLSRSYKPSTVFVGSIARVISAELVDWQASQASVKFGLNVSEDRAGTITTRQRELVVELIKTDASWLVNKYTWVK